jgi:hypothetical protein
MHVAVGKEKKYITFLLTNQLSQPTMTLTSKLGLLDDSCEVTDVKFGYS